MFGRGARRDVERWLGPSLHGMRSLAQAADAD